MKKILSLLAALGIVASAASTVVACAQETYKDELNNEKNESNEMMQIRKGKSYVLSSLINITDKCFLAEDHDAANELKLKQLLNTNEQSKIILNNKKASINDIDDMVAKLKKDLQDYKSQKEEINDYIYESLEHLQIVVDLLLQSQIITNNRLDSMQHEIKKLNDLLETGVVGSKGDKGDRGEKGDKGDKGDPGDRGEDGRNGRDGEKGDKGDRGDRGLSGEKGNQGLDGRKGDQGDKGIQGDKGDKGDSGQKGDTGDKGSKGDKGDTGEKGIKGDKGDKGDRGDAGDPGVKTHVNLANRTSNNCAFEKVTIVDFFGSTFGSSNLWKFDFSTTSFRANCWTASDLIYSGGMILSRDMFSHKTSFTYSWAYGIVDASDGSSLASLSVTFEKSSYDLIITIKPKKYNESYRTFTPAKIVWSNID